jgi:succinate dehydrogenase / fumarate reductase cytochrome b subunit
MIQRPLSPHLQVYRLPLTALISISHRLTGVVLTVGLLIFAICLMEASKGRTAYQGVQVFLSSAWGQVLVWGWIFSLLFHLCHGIRHLVWDVGYSFGKEALNRYAYLELLSAVILTVTVYVVSQP